MNTMVDVWVSSVFFHKMPLAKKSLDVRLIVPRHVFGFAAG